MSKIKANQIENLTGTLLTVSDIATKSVDIASKVSSASLSAGSGASLVGYLPSGTGAVATDVQSKLRESVSVKDFGAVGDGVTNNDNAFNLALNSGATRIHVPYGTYLLNNPLQIQAAALGVSIYGDGKQNTILRWVINTGTTSKFATLLDGYVGFESLTIENTGDDQTNSAGLVSYTPTVTNGMHDSRSSSIRLKGWGAGIGASINGTSLTMARSQVFACTFDEIEFYGCGKPIQLGVGVNNNVWIRPSFWDNKGNRHIYLVEGSSNTFISPQFEPVNASVTSGMLNAELVLSPNNVFLNAYFEPCYGILADSSPGTVVEAPIIEGFDFAVGTLSSSSILRSTNASNSGVYSYPIVSRVSLPTSRATTNPTSYCVSDDNTNTLTLIDARTSRDANFVLRPSGQAHGQIPVSYRGVWQPTIVGTSGTSAHTYTQQLGWYIRVGQLVTVFFRVAISAKDSGMGGIAQIAGLPFTVTTDTLFASAPIFAEYRVDLTVGYSELQGTTEAGSNYISLVQGGDNVPALYLPASGIDSVSNFVAQMTYITDQI